MRALLTALASSVALAAGCGVQTADQASVAGPDRVPYDLLAPAVEVTTTTTLPELASRDIQVWFVADDRIVSLRRRVAAPATLERALDALLGGLTGDEAALGLRSALTATQIADDSRVVAGIATIGLTPEFADASPRQQLLALAQLVYTATGLSSVEVVVFEIDGSPIEVPRADGSVSDRPVTRSDYGALVAGAG